VASFLAFGVVFCRVGPLEVVGSRLRESRESGSSPPRERQHGHGLSVRDVLYGPSSRAEDELGCVDGVQALRRAVSSLSRLPDGGNPADLCQARGLADARSSLPASEWARSQENERPAWNAPRRSRAASKREDRLDRHLRSDLPADDPAPRGVDERDVGHRFGGADGGLVRDSDGVRTFRVKDPVNEVRGDVGTTASLSSSPLGDARRPGSRTLP